MTSTLAHGAGRRPGEPVRPLRALAASPALISLLLGGLVLRLTIAYVLFPSSGFESDIASFVAWAVTLGEYGPGGFYANAGFADYPPAYLFLLWPIGVLIRSDWAGLAGAAADLVKLPPILLDLAVGYVVYRLVLGWSWPGRRAERLALAAAALYLFNPVSLYDSSLWGQAEAAGALVLLLGVAALVRGNSEGAAALAVVAALVKPQFGVVLLPLVGVVLLKRHLLRPGTGPRARPWGPGPVTDWLARNQGPARILTSVLAAGAAFLLLALPFGLGPLEYAQRMLETAGGYHWLSVNAFNGWALVGSGGTPSLAEALQWSDDTIGLLGPVPGVVIGALLLAAGYAWTLVRAAARDDRWTILVAATVLAMAFFVLPTRAHERYIFPAIAFLPILAVAQRRWAVALVLLSAGAFVNLHAILTLPLYGTANVETLPLGEAFRTPAFIVASALLQTGVGLWAAWQLRPSLASSPDAFDREACAPMPAASVVAARSPAGPVGSPWPSRSAPEDPLGAPGGSGLPGGSGSPEGTGSSWVRGPGALDWLVDRLTPRPRRGDRSSELVSEPPGRLDRLDLLVVVVLVVASLALRGFRLEEPYGMYFDEVYHARTATEFLQDWEYGQPHAIYEYTHPHLAKYAMALGIQAAGGNRVTASSQLGVPVLGAVLEPRWSPGHDPDRRYGDRLYVGTGSELRVYDLARRDLEHTIVFPATALAIDPLRHVLYVADSAGAISSLDTTRLDARRDGPNEPTGPTGPTETLEPEAFAAGPGRAVDRLVADDASLLTIAPGGTLTAFDPLTGERLAERFVSGISGVVALPAAERVVVDMQQVRAPARLATELATELGDDEERIQGLLGSGAALVVLDAYLDDAVRDRIASRIDAGGLPGVRLEQGPLLAVGAVDGVRVLDGRSLDQVDLVPTDAAVSGLVLVERGLSDPTLYLAAGTALTHIPVREDGLGSPSSLEMPGPVRQPAWNEPANLVHVLGDRPGGGSTLYVVEPHGDSVFADAALPTEPSFLLVDTQPERPSLDRGQILAVASDGSVAAVGILGNAFGWRLPGVLMGALGAALVYLLARLLFARRSVGLAAIVLVLAEGMLYANARIAMNDVYVTTFILVATLLFAAVYRGVISGAGLGLTALLGTGVALGLALASKWVAAYAIGGLVLLVLFRSGLGRLVALAGMIALTAVLGALAIRAPPELAAEGDPNRNWTFLLIMIALTALLAAAIVRRPLPIRRPEVWLAFAGCLVIGLAVLLAGMVAQRGTLPEGLTPFRLRVGGVLVILVGLGAVLAAWLAARAGRGPFVRSPSLAEDDSPAWFAPARLAGLPWLFSLAALTVVPVLLYVLSYAPWVALGNQWGLPLFPDGGTGQTLAELTASMYQYHDSLRAQHAASSPWWAWPFDLKPVWFYQEAFAGSTTGLIYDSGNLVVFWLGVPAMAFAAWAAWRRRSLSLTVIVIMWLALWLPWSRIDRATFQYHVYASLPFLLVALAYFLAELWHGATRHAWSLARVAAALAILGPPLLWLLRGPLCLAAGTETVNAGGQACGAPTRTVDVSHAALAAILFLALGVIIAVWLAWRTSRARSPRASWSLPALLGVILVTLAGVLVALTALSPDPAFSMVVAPESLALVALAALAVPATMALRARDARRFVIGVLGAAALWFLVWYPNLSGLPLPSDVASAYQGLLPTWNWDFQFAVNLDLPVGGGLVDVATLVVAAVTLLAVLAAAAAAHLRDRASDETATSTPADGLAMPGDRGRGAPSAG